MHLSDVSRIVKDKDIRAVLCSRGAVHSSARKYFRNMIRVRTGVNPRDTSRLNPESSARFLKHIWGMCLEWGNQRTNYIDRSIQQLEKFLGTFNPGEDIREFQVFLEKLKGFPSDRSVMSTSTDPVVELTELLQKFSSVRIKTASLIMRFLCLDCSFFDVDMGRLLPPLDRVNYRMCRKLFGSEFVICSFGELRGAFSRENAKAFEDLGKKIMGNRKVLIDNLWFIGHFYHDGADCEVRQAAKIVEYQYLSNIELPERCPFRKYGCQKPLSRANQEV